MQTLLELPEPPGGGIDATSLLASLDALLHAPAIHWQLGIVLSGILFAYLVGRHLKLKLQHAVYPGAIPDGLARTAMRTGMLATIPLILWLWLLMGSAILRRWQGVPTDVLHYAILLAGALTLIRMGVFVLRHSFSPGSKLKRWEGVLTATIWGIVALHILGWLPLVAAVLDENAIHVGSVRLSAYTAASFLLSIGVLLLLALWIAGAVNARIMRSDLLDLSAKVAVAKLSKFLLLTAAVLVAVITAGIDLTALTVFGGALGVGLGLGLQRVVSSFVSGFILVFENSLRPGDMISVGETFGVVRSLNARYVAVTTPDGLDILIPNEELTSSRLTSWCYEDRRVRVRVAVQISYDDDPEQAMAILSEIAQAHRRVLSEPRPEVAITEFADSGIQLELAVWLEDPTQGMKDVRSELYLQIWKRFKAADISIPYPHRQIVVSEAASAALAPRYAER